MDIGPVGATAAYTTVKTPPAPHEHVRTERAATRAENTKETAKPAPKSHRLVDVKA